jgi:predicted heme/steroid binding protein
MITALQNPYTQKTKLHSLYIHIKISLFNFREIFFALLLTALLLICFMSELPVYTKSQLALRNGQDKPEIWVAYKGLIYDVSRSRLWRNGKHYEHWAGQDLTAELPNAPHDEWVFQNFDPIGKLS